MRSKRVVREQNNLLLSPPRLSFGCQRNDGGPRPLRGVSPTEIYRYRDLDIKSAEKVCLGTLLAIRSAEIVNRAQQLDIPWLFEQPAPQEDRPHMLVTRSCDTLHRPTYVPTSHHIDLFAQTMGSASSKVQSGKMGPAPGNFELFNDNVRSRRKQACFDLSRSVRILRPELVKADHADAIPCADAGERER